MLSKFFNKNKFPIVRTNETALPNDYDGYVYIWDLDGTYLNTDINSFKSIMKIPFELAHEKENIPGSDVLLKYLRINDPSGEKQNNPIYFITASPPQFRNAIHKKMMLDGIEYNGIVFKDYFKILSKFMMKEVFNQITYKLIALLDNRKQLPKNSKEILFGDNLEQDAEIYSLYDKLLDKDADYKLIHSYLERLNVQEPYITQIINNAKSLNKGITENPVKRIYVHLTANEDISSYKKYSKKLIPVFNFFQASASLFENKNLSLLGVGEVFKKILSYKTCSQENIMYSLKEMKNNKFIHEKTEKEIYSYITLNLRIF